MQEANIQKTVKQKLIKKHRVTIVGAYGESLEEPLKATGSDVIFFDDLDSFWRDSLKNTPSLLMIHVKKMSVKDKALKDHPLIKNLQLPIIFIYENSSAPLLFSTFNLLSLGYLNLNLDCTGQLKAILNRYNQFLKKDKEIASLKKSKSLLGKNLDNVPTRKDSLVKKKTLFENLFQILKDLPTYDSLTDFNKVCEKIFTKWDIIQSFSIYSVNPTGQKLVCTEMQGQKYRKLPALWLGQKTEEGIEFYAQNMASQVAIEIMGINLVTLKIFGAHNDPDKLIFLKVDNQESFLGFDWQVLETFLSGAFSKFELNNTKIFSSSSLMIQPWDFMAKLDAQKWDVEEAQRLSVINIDLENLFNLVVNTPKVRFFWGDFINEFIIKLKNISSIPFQASTIQLGHVSFLVDQDQGSDFFDTVKKFSSHFPFWKFFEDYDLILPKDINPKVKMVPSSPSAYYKFYKDLRNEI